MLRSSTVTEPLLIRFKPKLMAVAPAGTAGVVYFASV